MAIAYTTLHRSSDRHLSFDRVKTLCGEPVELVEDKLWEGSGSPVTCTECDRTFDERATRVNQTVNEEYPPLER